MSCKHPILAIDLGVKTNKDGEVVRNIKLAPIRPDWSYKTYKEKYGDSLLCLPCGHCYGCAKDYSREWASRIILETQDHNANCFITLTYDESNVPDKPLKRDFQLFMKRLRKFFGDKRIRYFACGECGDKSGRPHYHAILFGLDFDDKVFLQRSKSGLFIYRSPTLEQLWPYGISSIGDVSVQSAQYVAKYSMKKKLSGVDTGEFVLMSRKPGIGASHYDEKFYYSDKVYVSGQSFKVPRYFDKIADSNNSLPYIVAKENRIEKARLTPDSKYRYRLGHQEEAWSKELDDMIYADCLKVRL